MKPIACIAPIDTDRQWLKAKYGLTTDETGREISFCGHTILSNEPTIVGIGLGIRPERGETTLRPGEEVWIYSDAAIELKDQSGRMFEVEGLIQAIAAVRASAGGTPTGRLRDLLSSVSGREKLDDDLSLMRLTFDPAQT